MNRVNMKYLITGLVVFLGMVFLPVSLAFADNCFDCHDQGDFQKQFRHQPVIKGECATCHSTHASRYPALLNKGAGELCRDCHAEFMDKVEKRDFLHQPVRNGECGACHEAHVADFKKLLKVKPGSECYTCHKKPEKVYAFPHRPFARNQCYSCHDPHAAADSRLLRKNGTRLCLSCHKAGAIFNKAHLNRDPKKLVCLSCHNPHGGDKPGLLRPVQHAPFSQGKCNSCHGRRDQGVNLCLRCHKSVLDSFLKPHTHLRLAAAGANFCLDCHDPHAGEDSGLPAVDQIKVCSSCHQDKFARRQQMLYHHPGKWECGDCHKLHGSDLPMMFKERPVELCADCHKRHEQFTHPIGDDSLDPRNLEPMSCITCHDPCTGTMFKYNLRGSAERGLCIQCHPKH